MAGQNVVESCTREPETVHAFSKKARAFSSFRTRPANRDDEDSMEDQPRIRSNEQPTLRYKN